MLFCCRYNDLRLKCRCKRFFPFFNNLDISQFSFKPCYLLLEDETHSTGCLGNSAKYISKSLLRNASVNSGREAGLRQAIKVLGTFEKA